MDPQKIIHALPLTAVAFAPFGHVLSFAAGPSPIPANRGTAQMVGHLGQVDNLRPEKADQNWKIYRCTPEFQRPIPLRDLEKHPFSSQLFAPLGGRSRYLVTVAHGEQAPALYTLHAFIANANQAIIYLPGVWHQPMTVLEQEMDMLSLVYEDGSPDDCHLFALPGDPALSIAFE